MLKKRGEESLQDFLEIFGGNNMRKEVIAAMAAGLVLVAANLPKNKLPEQFRSLDGTVAGEYLLAATVEGNNTAYQKAIASVDEPDLKARISAYASHDLYRQAQHTQSTSQKFRNLELAVMLAPTQETKEAMIDLSMALAEPYRENLSSFHSDIAALYLRSVAGKTGNPEKRTQLLGLAATIYQGLANKANSHDDRANYLSAAANLRRGTL